MKTALCVVEDDPEMTELVRVLLEDLPIEIKGTCATAHEAVALARTLSPDLVILDHFIEGEVMGLEAAASIKEAAPTTKIILLSGHDLAIEAQRTPAIDAFLPKSRVEELAATSMRLLER